MNKNFEQFKLKTVDELLKIKKTHLREVPLEIAKLAQSGRKSTQKIKDLKKEIGLTERLKDFGVPDDREKLMPTVELAGSDSGISYNPRYAEEEDILNLYLKAL